MAIQPLRSPRCVLLLAIFLAYIQYTLASPINTSNVQATSLRPREIMPDGALNCETERSSDYYGIGVRLGVYFAWLQAWIANVSVPSEIGLAQDTNAIFLFAILVSMVRCTVTGLLLQLDGLLLMHMGGGSIFSVLSLWGYRTCIYDVKGPVEGIRRFGGWGTHFRLLLCMGISTFGLFFWVWGINGELNADLDPGCEIVYTFLFSKLRADGGIRIPYIIICVGCMLYFGTMLLTSLVAARSRINRWMRLHKDGDLCEKTRTKFMTGLNQKQLRSIFYFLRIGNFIFIIYSILLIEFTLNYNHVAGVLGWRGHIFFPSQVIPMIIGAFGFCRVIWIRYCQWKSPDYMTDVTARVKTLPRSILKSDAKELIKIYSPKSNMSRQFANERRDDEIDPAMRNQPTWLRILVSWLPWLGVVRWWTSTTSQEDDYDDKSSDRTPTSPSLTSAGWSSSESTPRFGSPEQRHDTWDSIDTVTSRTNMELPQIPKNMSRFGSMRV